MFGLTILDLALILTLLSYLIYGLRNGFLVTLGGIAGFAAGAVAAFVSVPLVSDFVDDSGWRLTAIVGHRRRADGPGPRAGHHDRPQNPQRRADQPLRAVDRVVGGGRELVVSALVMSMLAFSISALGVPSSPSSWPSPR